MFKTHMLCMMSVPFFQRSRMRRSLFSPDSSIVCGFFFLWWWPPLITYLPSSLSDLAWHYRLWIRRLLRTCKGVKAFLARLATLSQISLCRVVTRPPFLQLSVWAMDNLALYPSQQEGRSGDSTPRQRMHHQTGQ